jgi:alanine racemase
MLSRNQTPTFANNQERDTYAWFSQRAWVEIDLGALSHNVQQLVQFLSPNTQLMAVVKADAYGHGAVTVAQTAVESGAGWLGVATVPEGIQFRCKLHTRANSSDRSLETPAKFVQSQTSVHFFQYFRNYQ